MQWKTSCLVPVPEVCRSVEMNDFRPVAPTFHIMKTMQHLVPFHEPGGHEYTGYHAVGTARARCSGGCSSPFASRDLLLPRGNRER